MISFKEIVLQRIETAQTGKVKYSIDGKECFAEEAVILCYEKGGYKALWTENTYWWAIMSLLFWDVIFARVRGAVKTGGGEDLSPNDSRYEALYKATVDLNGIPADFFTGEFYSNRRALVHNRIKELENSDIKDKFLRSYEKNYRGSCRPAEALNKFTRDQFLLAFDKLEKKVILAISERLITNYVENRQGLPDLIVYNDNESFFAEVKSEKDKVSEKQQDWHSFLSDGLNLKIEICLINKTAKQLQSIKECSGPQSSIVEISFGASSSKKREDAVNFIKGLSTYFSEGEGKEQIHGCKLSLADIEDVFKLLDFTSGWKNQRIRINGEEVKSTELRASLYCYREKSNQKASSDYCKKDEQSGETNKFGCKQIYFWQLANNRWEEYGYIDSETGDWVFDSEAINKKCAEEINRLKYCPLFDEKKIKALVAKTPQKINPRKDNDWAYISNDHNKWVFSNNEWYGGWGQKKFPGNSAMIGVEKVSKREVNEQIKYAKMASEDISIIVSPDSRKRTERKSGCFIATAVYGSIDAYEVNELRNFRDNYLERHVLGRIAIGYYYQLGPYLARYIQNHLWLKALIRKLLDRIVSLVECNSGKRRLSN